SAAGGHRRPPEARRGSLHVGHSTGDGPLMPRRSTTLSLRALAFVLATMAVGGSAATPAPPTLEIRDYTTLPITRLLDGTGQTDGLLARVNSIREEPGGATRFFVNDLNGPLYILDKASKKLTTYLDFNGRGDRPGLFHKFTFDVGYANGLVTVQFDPDY